MIQYGAQAYGYRINKTKGVPRYKAWEGVALFKQGFRPFFLAAGLSALVLVMNWVISLLGNIDVYSNFDPVDWHAHKMVFGMASAAIAGFFNGRTELDWTHAPARLAFD